MEYSAKINFFELYSIYSCYDIVKNKEIYSNKRFIKNFEDYYKIKFPHHLQFFLYYIKTPKDAIENYNKIIKFFNEEKLNTSIFKNHKNGFVGICNWLKETSKVCMFYELDHNNNKYLNLFKDYIYTHLRIEDEEKHLNSLNIKHNK